MRRRHAFTLIEVLVVLAIIGVVMGLLLVAIGGATRRTDTAVVEALIDKLEMALEQFKTRFGIYPPSAIRLKENATYTDSRTTPAERFENDSKLLLRKIWPDIEFDDGSGTVSWDLDDDGATTGDFTLNGPLCLVFFLGGMPEVIRDGGGALKDVLPGTGFAKDPTNPFRRRAGGDTVDGAISRDGPYYEFRTSELLRSPTAVLYGLKDPFDTGMPIVYFSGYGGYGYNAQDCNAPGQGSETFTSAWGSSVPSVGPNPYTTSDPAPSGGGNATFWNAKGYQLISAGMDGKFGAGGKFVPGKPLDVSTQQDDRDNLTNFHDGILQTAETSD